MIEFRVTLDYFTIFFFYDLSAIAFVLSLYVSQHFFFGGVRDKEIFV
jgi:hypothetical protein